MTRRITPVHLRTPTSIENPGHSMDAAFVMLILGAVWGLEIQQVLALKVAWPSSPAPPKILQTIL